MLSLTATDSTLTLLRQVTSLSEIRDKDGNVIGFFAPVSIERAHLYAQAAAQIDPLEIKQRKETGWKTHTTQEVLAHLKSLEQPPTLDELLGGITDDNIPAEWDAGQPPARN